MLAHKAEEEGVAAVESMAGHAGHVNYDAIPNVVYTWPELASVGLSEEEAAQRGLDGARSARSRSTANAPRALHGRDRRRRSRSSPTRRPTASLGVHILGPRASDLIAEAAVAMEFGASAEDIARTVHAHPTLAEALKEAALAVDGRPLNI